MAPRKKKIAAVVKVQLQAARPTRRRRSVPRWASTA